MTDPRASNIPLMAPNIYSPTSTASPFPSPNPDLIQYSPDPQHQSFYTARQLEKQPQQGHIFPPPPDASQIQRTPQEKLARMQTWRRRERFIGYILSLFSVFLACIMDGILAYVLYTFNRTKDIPAPGRVSPWAKDTELWPAIMLLTGSSLTLIIDSTTLLAAFFVCSRRAHGAEGKLVKVGYVIFVIKWVFIAVLYRTGKTTKDLWGWACDTRAANIQKYYVTDLDFAKLCKVQTASWGLSLTEMFLKMILMGFIFWVSHKLKKLRTVDGGGEKIHEVEPMPGKLRRPPTVLWQSVIEVSKALGGSAK